MSNEKISKYKRISGKFGKVKIILAQVLSTLKRLKYLYELLQIIVLLHFFLIAKSQQLIAFS